MNILAIDTTTKKACVVIKKEDKIFEGTIDNEITHSEKLMPLLHTTLKQANLELKDIDMFITTIGPGSFTGVRIGISTIKALAKVLDKKIFGITSLELMALDTCKTSSPSFVLSLMDARNSRVYYSLYKNSDKLTELDFSGNDLLEDVLTKLQNMNLDNLIVAVDSKDLLELVNKTDLNAVIANANLSLAFDLDLSNSIDYLTLDARYFRKSEAERTKNGE